MVWRPINPIPYPIPSARPRSRERGKIVLGTHLGLKTRWDLLTRKWARPNDGIDLRYEGGGGGVSVGGWMRLAGDDDFSWWFGGFFFRDAGAMRGSKGMGGRAGIECLVSGFGRAHVLVTGARIWETVPSSSSL